MAGLAELEQLCRVLPDRIEEAASVLAAGATRTIGGDVIDHTPVDTSEAESNWQASLNAAPNFPLPPIYPGERGSTAAESAAAAKSHIQRALADKKPGEAVYLSNLAEHIVDLNNGSSRQEPAGFVERAMVVGEQFVGRSNLEVKA